MLKKKSGLLLFILLSAAEILSAESFTDLFAAEETAVDYYLTSNYVCINEYNLSYTGNISDIEKDIEGVKALIKAAGYAKAKFDIPDFYPAEECLSNEGNYVKGRYDLLTPEAPSFKMIEGVFSKVLKRKVQVSSDGNYVIVSFDGTGIKVRQWDAEKAWADGNKIILQWPGHLSRMELVFSADIKNSQPVLKYVDAAIKSPEKTAGEIDYIKNGLPELSGVEKELQDDCDVVRLKHLKYYADLIEEYKEKTGCYPFEEASQTQVYSFVYNKKQKKYASDSNPNKHVLHSPEEFFAELEKGLGRKIEQKFDPQYAPTCRPVFYIYMIQGDTYYFAVHLSKYYPFSKRVEKNYYKAEVSNKSDSKNKFYTIKELSENNKYIEAVSVPLKKEGYFLEREEKHRAEY